MLVISNNCADDPAIAEVLETYLAILGRLQCLLAKSMNCSARKIRLGCVGRQPCHNMRNELIDVCL